MVPTNAHVAKIKAPMDNQSEYLLLRDRGVRGVRGLFATGRYSVFSPMVFICFVIFYSRNYTWKRLFLLGLHADEAQVHVDVDPSPSEVIDAIANRQVPRETDLQSEKSTRFMHTCFQSQSSSEV